MSVIRVELQLSDGSFSSGMLRAGQTVSSLRKELERTDPHFRKITTSADGFVSSIKRVDVEQKSLLSTMRDISIVTGAVVYAFQALTGAGGGIIGSITSINAEMERLRFQMQGMSTSANPMKEAASAVDYLRQKAKETPFSLAELANSFVKLKSTGTDPMAGSLQAITDGIAAFGGSDESLHRVVLGLTQMSGKGVIQMEELRQQLGESMPNAMRLMARSMGVSVAELTKTISTGTVESKSALEKFYAELERTYGGEGKRMMATFSGQVSQLKANLQTLATQGGLKEFFEAQKAGLVQLNDFLQTDQAKRFAESLGQALTSAVQGFGIAVQTVYKFRGEIVLVAKAVSGLFIISRVTAILGGFVTTISLARASIGGIIAGINAAQVSMTSAATSATVLGGSVARAGALMAGATTIAVGFGRAVMVMTPWISGIALIATLVAGNFGVMSGKINEAYGELIKFGAESRKQAEDVLKAKEAQLVGNIDSIKSIFYSSRTKSKELAVAEQELQNFYKMRSTILEKADAKDAEASLRVFQRTVDERVIAQQEVYKQAQAESDAQYETDLQAAEGNSDKKIKLDEEYRARNLNNRIKDSQATLDIYDRMLGGIALQSKTANDQELLRFKAQAALVRSLRIAEFEKLNGMKDFGIDTAPKFDDPTAKLSKGQKLLEQLQADVADLSGEISGADGAYEKMMFRINRGDFGSIKEGGKEVVDLTNALLAATQQKEALDLLMKGDKEADADLARVKAKNLEHQLELQEKLAGSTASESEKMKARLDAGAYAGLGPMDNIREDVMAVVGAFNIQGAAAGQVGIVIRENAFGSASIKSVNDMKTAILDLNSAITGMNTSLSGTSFSGFNSAAGNFNQALTGFSGEMLDLIAAGESRKSDNNGYNTTLDNGRWTNGPQNLVAMTLNQIVALGNAMRTPDNQAKYEGGGSSALGRYQIVGKTLKSLMAEMGLNGSELFDQQMQDDMAKALLRRRGNDPTGLRQEWTSLKNVDDATLQATYARQAQAGPTKVKAAALQQPIPVYDAAAIAASSKLLDDRVAKTNELTTELEKQKAIETSNLDLEQQVARKEILDDIIAKTREASTNIEDLGANFARVEAAIKSGKLGKSKDVNAAEYKTIVDAARELDKTEKSIKQTKEASSNADAGKIALDQERLRISKEILEAQKLAANPDYEGNSGALDKLTEDLNIYLDNVKRAYGADTQEYKDALKYKEQALAGQLTLDAEQKRAALSSENRAISDSLLTQGQLRQTQMDRDLKRIDDMAATMRKAGISEVQIVEETERAKQLIRQKYATIANPVAKQMQEWADLQGNLMEKTTGWMDAAADGVTGLIMGTGDLAGTLKGILADLVNTHVKSILSSVVGDKATKAAGSKFGGDAAAGAAKDGAGKAGKLVGMAHTGGIAGGRLGSRRASAAMFHNAPKFHTGGIIGPRLSKNEVPIIAKEEEGIFTKEQMKALSPVGSGGQVFQINAPVTVNGSAGTPDQNTDLAKRMAKEMEGVMRGAVQDEMRKQTRPGSMMNTRTR